jgi:hypothetical protein
VIFRLGRIENSITKKGPLETSGPSLFSSTLDEGSKPEMGDGGNVKKLGEELDHWGSLEGRVPPPPTIVRT